MTQSWVISVNQLVALQGLWTNHHAQTRAAFLNVRAHPSGVSIYSTVFKIACRYRTQDRSFNVFPFEVDHSIQTYKFAF